MASSLADASSLAKIEAFCGRVRSTTSSGRSDAGKNCRGTKGSRNNESTKQASVSATVNQRWRIAASRIDRKSSTTLLGFCFAALSGTFNSHTPSSGANRTATNQDTINAIVTTAKIEKVYSPAELLAKPIGTKPAAVTKDPVNIGNANVRYANVAASSLLSPAANREVMTSTVVIASSTSSPRAMISAPSEIRCRSIAVNCMTGNTMASVNGIERAMTAPARNPRLTKLTAMIIAMACQSDVVKSRIA